MRFNTQLAVVALVGFLSLIGQSAAMPTATTNSTALELESLELPLSNEVDLEDRDVYSNARKVTGGGAGPRLTTTGPRSAGAESTNIPINGASLFAWHSKTPARLSDTEEVYIVQHGNNRNAHAYFSYLNNAWAQARDSGMASANSIRLAPLFFSASRDSRAMSSNHLGWDEPSAWAGGDGSITPRGSNISPFTVYDALIARYSNRANYPRVRKIVFVGHGAGAQVLQRYAVLGRDAPAGIQIRYAIGDPSSMLHFTRDRPVPVNTGTCSSFNQFRYGFDRYSAPYGLAGSPSSLFKRYVSRDVRYMVGMEDTRADAGDQLCGGRAMGGEIRRDRSLNYWAYIHLLAGSRNTPSYPGFYPALDNSASKAARFSPVSRFPQTTSAGTRNSFTGVTVRHRLHTVPGVGHSASGVLRSGPGIQAIFAN